MRDTEQPKQMQEMWHPQNSQQTALDPTPEGVRSTFRSNGRSQHHHPLPWSPGDRPMTQKLKSLKKNDWSLNAKEARALYDRMSEAWVRSEAPEPLLKALSHLKKGVTMAKAVAFGIGPIAGNVRQGFKKGTYGLKAWKACTMQSTHQLIVFRRAVDHLATQLGIKQIEMYAQDPRYSTEDEELLQSLGIKVVWTPEGESAIESTTFVFAPHVRVLHSLDTLTRCTNHQPAFYIGHHIDSIIGLLSAPSNAEVWGRFDHGRIVALVRQMRAYKVSRIFCNVSKPNSELELFALLRIHAHIRRENFAAWNCEQECTPSCTKLETPTI